MRVSPFFFVMSFVLGYNGSMGPNFSQGAFLMIWTAACFGSILLHELGHSLTMRRYGIHSYIVLYHFGGVAVPETSSYRRTNHLQQIAILAAGPGIQLAFAAILITALSSMNYLVPIGGFVRRFIPAQTLDAQLLPPMVALAVSFLLYVNIYWALLNLIPVYPLDGGQIFRELFYQFGVPDAGRKSLMLSVAASIVIVVFALQRQEQYLALMFGMLGFQSYTALQRW